MTDGLDPAAPSGKLKCQITLAIQLPEGAALPGLRETANWSPAEGRRL